MENFKSQKSEIWVCHTNGKLVFDMNKEGCGVSQYYQFKAKMIPSKRPTVSEMALPHHLDKDFYTEVL